MRSWSSGRRIIKRINVTQQSVPEPGWTTPATVVEVYDGDTITVEVTRRFRVRLLDCWAPEIRGKGVDAEQRQRGLNARENLLAMLPINSACTVHIPSDRQDANTPLDIGSLTSMSRVLGEVYRDGINVGDQQIADGHATKTKAVK